MSSRIALLKEILEQGIGADIVVEADTSGLRTSLRTHFVGLTQNQGPVCTIVPAGLKRHIVSIAFGAFSLPCISQMREARAESQAIARGLIQQVARYHSVELSPEQSLDSWTVLGPEFGIKVTVRDVEDPARADSIAQTARTVMVPMMAAMAELIGYDEVGVEGDVEGASKEATILRRERSPRNRLLCLSIHGNRCIACGMLPAEIYGEAGGIIEVHHLEPLALTASPRVHDPREDLVPLCPCCHRAVHTRRPIPYTIEELKELLARGRR